MIEDVLTIGVLTPHRAEGPEVELPAMTRGRVATVMSRTLPPSGTAQGHSPQPHAELRASTEPAALERAVADFEGATLAAVAHASTTSGYVLGRQEESVLVERLSQRFNLPAVVSCAAAATALQTHGVSRVQLVHPPWFDDAFDALGVAYFRSHGLDAAVTKAAGLPGDPARIDPPSVVQWVEQHVEGRAEAVFLAGNGFRAADAVEELEVRTGKLVIEANQALLWGVLSAAGAGWDVAGYGRLLRRAS